MAGVSPDPLGTVNQIEEAPTMASTSLRVMSINLENLGVIVVEFNRVLNP
jgi:hypothetical protein